MKIVIAPQSFKGALTGQMAAKAIAQGVSSVYPKATTLLIPIADGGDGTLDVLHDNGIIDLFSSKVTGPMNQAVTAKWGVMSDGTTAIIELAQASGLALVTPQKRDPRTASSVGTGELLRIVLNHGYRNVILFLGGSATNDAGAGLAQALGVRLLDKNGKELRPGGIHLIQLETIDITKLDHRLKETNIVVATDVTNPLLGPNGASAVYGPQKGASPNVARKLDAALTQFARIVKKDLGREIADCPGAGAAGGVGGALLALTDSTVQSGIDLICDMLHLDEHFQNTNLVITGEGRIDRSTIFNKAPVGLARRAKTFGIPVIALAGSLGYGYREVYSQGIDAVVCILDRPLSFIESVDQTYQLLSTATERALRLLHTNALSPH
jgi:glycerate kinase